MSEKEFTEALCRFSSRENRWSRVSFTSLERGRQWQGGISLIARRVESRAGARSVNACAREGEIFVCLGRGVSYYGRGDHILTTLCGSSHRLYRYSSDSRTRGDPYEILFLLLCLCLCNLVLQFVKDVASCCYDLVWRRKFSDHDVVCVCFECSMDRRCVNRR